MKRAHYTKYSFGPQMFCNGNSTPTQQWSLGNDANLEKKESDKKRRRIENQASFTQVKLMTRILLMHS